MLRLDEATMLETPQLKLKLVRYVENLPLHFVGKIYVVVCSSANSAGLPAGETNDAGWRVIGRGAAIGSKSAAEVAQRVRSEYTVLEGGAVYWSYVPLSISRDGCRTVMRWNPATLPPDWIVPAEKPDYCAPKGHADCRMDDFQGARLPEYSNVRIGPGTHVSFDVKTAALRGEPNLHVSSEDEGRTWQIAKRAPAGGAR